MYKIFCVKGDYDLVITDYMRGKSLFGDTDVKIFKKGKALFLSFIILSLF